jgi:hypothetical protein
MRSTVYRLSPLMLYEAHLSDDGMFSRLFQDSVIVGVFSVKINISSIFTPKYREILKARSRDGTYFSFSMARIVWRLTPIA